MSLRIISLFFFFFLNTSYIYSEPIIYVSVEKPKKELLSSSIKIPATVMANESVEITSVVSEKIKKILFKEGNFVKKGQLLVELVDDEEGATLNQTIAELEEANLNYERALKLSIKGNISQSILDNRLMIKKKLTSKVNEIKAQIDDLKIKAPFDGYTSIRNFSEGALLQPGDVITNLYDISMLRIQAFVSENYISKINSESKFNVEINLDKKFNLSGKISVIDPLIDKRTRTFKIIGKIKNHKNQIKPGMMVNLTIPLAKRNAIFVKEGAVFNEDDISYVYTVSKNKIDKKRIQIGSREKGLVEIIKGIDINDSIVFEGINKIKKGSKVKIK